MSTGGPFWLGESPRFPSPELADENGLLALGGTLDTQRLLSAYSSGVFPWPLDDDWSPMLWFSPDQRFVLFPGDLHVSRSLRGSLRNGGFEVRFDTDFEGVVQGCATAPRGLDTGTWITPEMIDAYTALHHEGHAHSFESWKEGELQGGVYGVALGRAFFAESMFYREPNASKVALVRMVESLGSLGFSLIDCQQRTENLKRFGACGVPRRRFLALLEKAVGQPTRLPLPGVVKI